MILNHGVQTRQSLRCDSSLHGSPDFPVTEHFVLSDLKPTRIMSQFYVHTAFGRSGQSVISVEDRVWEMTICPSHFVLSVLLGILSRHWKAVLIRWPSVTMHLSNPVWNMIQSRGITCICL